MSLKERDKKHLWHPLKQHQTHPDSLAIVKAKDCTLIDENGNEVPSGAADFLFNVENPEATVKAIAETGVDMISTSKITMSAPTLDLGLDIRIS